MFRCRITDEQGRGIGRPFWATGVVEEAQAHDFVWSEVLQAHVKPATAPRDDGQWPHLIEGGVYWLTMPNGVETVPLVAEQGNDLGTWTLYPMTEYVRAAEGSGDTAENHMVEPHGVVYDARAQPVCDWTALKFSGVTLFAVYDREMTPGRAHDMGEVVQQGYQKLLGFESKHPVLKALDDDQVRRFEDESASAAAADEQADMMGM